MPILKRDVDVHPKSLFEIPLQELPWWVAHVRSRQEKALTRHLQPAGVPFYLPQFEKRIRRDGRTFHSYLPLFPGYLFFRGSLDDRILTLKSHLVVQVLPVIDQGLLHGELTQLHSLQLSGVPLVPHPYIGPGSIVNVVEGPFKGYTGVVSREKGRLRLVISVSMLWRAVLVELEREAVSPDPRYSRTPQRVLAVAS